MRYDTLLEEVSARPGYLLLAFLLLLAVMHLVLLLWLKLDDLSWKKVDYVWLGAAALGLMASSAQAGRMLSERYLITERASVASAYSLLRDTLSSPPGVCMPRSRTEWSPPEFDAIVKEQVHLCSKALEVAERMKPLLDDFPPLEETGFQVVGEQAVYERDLARHINEVANEYRQYQQRYAALLQSTRQSTPELMFSVLGPLLIAFALALRITKVTGEIKNARAKSAA
jgi:hypothetical protein